MEQNSIRPITDGELERIADHIKSMREKCERYEAALKAVCNFPDNQWHGKAIRKLANEALSAGEGKKEVRSEYVAYGPDLYKRDHYPEGLTDIWIGKYPSDDAAKKAAIRWNKRRDEYNEAIENQKEDKQ